MKELVDALISLAKENAGLSKGDGMRRKEEIVVPPKKEEPPMDEGNLDTTPPVAIGDKKPLPKEGADIEPKIGDEVKAPEAVAPEKEVTIKDLHECMTSMKQMMEEMKTALMPKIDEPEVKEEGEFPPKSEPLEDKPPELPKAPVTEAVDEEPENKVNLGESHIPMYHRGSEASDKISKTENLKSDIRRALGISA